MIKVFVMLNNYFHDLATALLMTSGIAVYYLAKAAEQTNDREVIRYFADSFRKLTLLGRAAFIWIIGAGVVRLVAYKDFEWAEAVGKDQVPALVVKHLIMFTVVGVGVYYWRKLNTRVKELRTTYALDAASAKPTDAGSAKAQTATD